MISLQSIKSLYLNINRFSRGFCSFVYYLIVHVQNNSPISEIHQRSFEIVSQSSSGMFGISRKSDQSSKEISPWLSLFIGLNRLNWLSRNLSELFLPAEKKIYLMSNFLDQISSLITQRIEELIHEVSRFETLEFPDESIDFKLFVDEIRQQMIVKAENSIHFPCKVNRLFFTWFKCLCKIHRMNRSDLMNYVGKDWEDVLENFGFKVMNFSVHSRLVLLKHWQSVWRILLNVWSQLEKQRKINDYEKDWRKISWSNFSSK